MTILLLIQQTIMCYTPIDTTLLRYYNAMIQQAITLPFLLIQQSNLLLFSDWYNKLLCYYTTIDTTILHYYTPIDTTHYYAPISLRTHNQLLCYYSPTDTACYHVIILLLILPYATIPQLIQQATMLTHHHWYNKPLQYYISIDTAKLLCSYNNLNTMILDSNLHYYYTTMIQEAFLWPYDTLDTEH